MLGIHEPSVVHNVHVISQGTFREIILEVEVCPNKSSPLSPPVSSVMSLRTHPDFISA